MVFSMKSFKLLILLPLVLLLSFHPCLAEQEHATVRRLVASSYPASIDVSHQFIIQFEKNELGEASKQNLSIPSTSSSNETDEDGDEEEEDDFKVVKEIKSRNIKVVKFRDRAAAAKWRKNAKGVKYFEKGEK